MADESDGSKCSICKIIFEDVKSAIQCIRCKHCFHGRCVNVNLRGFHLRRGSWKCKSCEPESEVIPDNNKPKKRTRSDCDNDYIDHILQRINQLTALTEDMNSKINFLIEENTTLKKLILKSENTNSDNTPKVPSYAAAAKQNKVLIVKPKTAQKDTKVKEDLKNKISPSKMGVGVSMGRLTKNGGLILNCTAEDEVVKIQNEIQTQLGDTYEVNRPKLLQRRLKVIGVHESESNNSDEVLLSKVIKQNDLQANTMNSSLKVLRRTKTVKNRFNVIFEMDKEIYDIFVNKGKINIGWNRCIFYDDYGVIKCFNCSQYGHIAKDCKNAKACSKCGGEHDQNVCTSDVSKCVNCSLSNVKFSLNLKTDHPSWDLVNCETYKKMEEIRSSRFAK